MAETKVKKQHSKSWHIAWRSIIGVIDGLLAVAGIIFIVLGFISDYLPKKNSENWTGNATFAANMHMGYRWFGFILLAGAVLILAIFFNVMAHHDEANRERELRRQERMKILAASASETTIEATSPATEVHSTAPEATKTGPSSETKPANQ
ncbi:MAG: hypothetical protein PUC66_03840 [Erysipelotrichaceae bacterium]|nr:hypothetical protein [Erysipelotrichaceae bacterium]